MYKRKIMQGLLKALKNLDHLIKSQRSDQVKEGVGYNVVPPPAADLYLSPKKDLSWTEGQNKDSSTIEDVASPNLPKPFVKFVKPKDSQPESKSKEQETPKKSQVKYAEQYRHSNKRPKGNQRNWNNLKSYQLGPEETTKSQNLPYKSSSHRSGGHKPHGAPMRPPLRSSGHKPHGGSMRPSQRSAGHRPHGPLMNPMRPTMNGARPYKSFFIHLPSYETRPFLKSSAIKNQYRAPWVPTVNRYVPSVNRKFSTGRRNFPTTNRKFPTASRKFTTGSTKNHIADMGKKGKAVQPSACWTWNPSQELSNKVTKNEATGILKKFIREIENLVDKKVKVIRCNNRTEFKNSVMNDFCAMKVKPHNKTPYELFRGRTPAVSFIRPFGCHVTILNTLDHFGKFDGKADEGYFVRYSINSKAFRVYNIRTRRVEENFHIEFLENKNIIAGAGPEWLFDINMLTKSINNVPVIAGTNFDDFTDGSPLFDYSLKISGDAGKKNDEVSDKENRASNELNYAFEKLNTKYPNNPKMHGLETIATYDDFEEVADFTNLESLIQVCPTPTTRTHKDHPLKKMDVKNVFLYERIEEEVYVCQPPGFEDPNNPDKVYVDDIIFGSTKKELCTEFERLMKDKFQMSSMGELTFFLGLQVKQKEDGIFISQDKYVTKVLRKFNFLDVKFSNTPVDRKKTLANDADGADVDVHLYRSMIVSLMYLIASRPDIMYAAFWYPKDSPFELVAYTDSDYAEANLDKKSTTGSSEYVAAASCCGQKAIERLKQGESINVQDLETNLYWEFGKFTSQDGESLESYYSRFYKMMNELVRNQCDVTNHQVNVQFLLQLQPEWQRFVTLVKQCQELKTVSYHKLYDILKQHQNEVNEIRAERLARKKIVNSPPPIYDQEPAMVAENDEISKDKEIDKLMALISLSFKKIYKPTNNNLRTSSNTSRVNQDNSPMISKGIGFDNQRIGNVARARETIDQELEAHYMYMTQIQDVTPDAADNSGPIFDSEPLQKVDQDDDDLANERDLLASLIEKLKYEIDDNKNHNKFLETSNKALVEKLQGQIEDFKNKNKSLESSNNHFKEANNELSKINQLMYKDLKKFQVELDKYNDVKYASKVEIDCAKANGDLVSYKMESEKSFNAYTQKINDLNQRILEMKKELFAHQETISIPSQQKEAQLKFYKTREDKEIDKVIVLGNKIKDLDNIVYKTGQSVQAMNMLNRNCKTSLPNLSSTRKLKERIPVVIPPTSVSRPQLKSNQIKNRVMLNNSQGKKQKVEDHHRNVKFSKNKTSVTACNDSLNAKTSNLIEIILFIVDSGCSKHMTGNLKLLTNFVEKFLGTVKFGNDQIAPILGYGDPSTCYIRDLKGNDILTDSRETDLYSITLQDMSSPNPICLMAKATSSQAWLWHHRPSHLNFDTINLISKNDIVIGLPELKFIKDHLCSSYEVGRAKRKSFQTKTTPSSKRWLQLLHMDLCSPMRVESINGKKYVLVIVNDYSRYTWTHFLRSKDETPEVLIDFLRFVQRGLHAQVRIVRTDKGTEFLNKTLHAYFTSKGINHQTSVARTPEQNGIVVAEVLIVGYEHVVMNYGSARKQDETPDVLIDFLRLVQRGLQAHVRVVRTDKGTKFLNQALHAYFVAERILHQTSVARTPKQNGVVERRNRSLVEAARTMLSAAKVPLFF
nr:hypothetical protein [Tanacetum cinerariifolium]